MATTTGKRYRKYNDVLKKSPNYFKPRRYQHYLTIKELAVAVGKEPSWIKRLERRGTLSAPVRVKRGQLEIRLYSPDDVKDIKKRLEEIRIGRPRKSD